MRGLKTIARFVADIVIVSVPPLVRSAIGLAGAGLVSYGAAEIFRPAGFIVGGLLLLVIATLLGRGSA